MSFGGRSAAVCHVGRMWIGLRVSEIVGRIVMCVVVPVLVDRGCVVLCMCRACGGCSWRCAVSPVVRVVVHRCAWMRGGDRGVVVVASVLLAVCRCRGWGVVVRAFFLGFSIVAFASGSVAAWRCRVSVER